MSDITNKLQEIEEKYSDKLNFDNNVVFIKFEETTETLDKFIKNFKKDKFKEIAPLLFVSKEMNSDELESFKTKVDKFSMSVYRHIPMESPDYINKVIEASKYSMGLIEYGKASEISDKLETTQRLESYKDNLNIYRSKLAKDDFSEKYIAEFSNMLEKITDHSSFTSKNNIGLKELVSDIYYLARRVADKNDFDFTIKETNGLGFKNAVNGLLKDVETNGVLSNSFDIYAKGFDVKVLADMIRNKFEDVDLIRNNKPESEVEKLEKQREQRYIHNNPITSVGFTLSKERLDFSDKNSFEIILENVAKTAIDEVRYKRTVELHEKLTEMSKSTVGVRDLSSALDEFVNTDRVKLRKDWSEQLDNKVEVEKPKLRKIKM